MLAFVGDGVQTLYVRTRLALESHAKAGVLHTQAAAVVNAGAQARSAEEKKMLSNRINRIVGQMTGIGKMVDEDRYCDDILIQLSAIDKAIKSLANVILDTHIHTCMVEEIQNGNTAVVDEIVDLFRRFQ